MAKELCPGSAGIHVDANVRPIGAWAEFDDVRPSGQKRMRLRCPHCGRKIVSSVRLCHDGCCVIHSIPAHKPKGWWKRASKTT